MPCCSAGGCSNRSEHGIRLFGFPFDKNRRKSWEENLKRHNWTAKPGCSKLCEAHFEPDQFETHRVDRKRKLKPNAVPTIFSDQPVPNRRKLCRYRSPRLSSDHSYCASSQTTPSKEGDENESDTNTTSERPAVTNCADNEVSSTSTEEKLKEAQKKLCAMQKRMTLMQEQLKRLKREKSELVKNQVKRMASLRKLLTDDQRRALGGKHMRGSKRSATNTVDKALQLRFVGLLDLTSR